MAGPQKIKPYDMIDTGYESFFVTKPARPYNQDVKVFIVGWPRIGQKEYFAASFSSESTIQSLLDLRDSVNELLDFKVKKAGVE